MSDQAARARATALRALVNRVVAVVERGAAAFLALVTAIMFISIITRYVFSHPIPDIHDLSRLMLGIAVFWGVACGCWRGGHIQVDLLWSALPYKGRLIMDLVSSTIQLAFMIVLVWMVLARLEEFFGNGVATMDLRIPMWPFFTAAAIGLTLSLALLPAHIYRLLTDAEES